MAFYTIFAREDLSKEEYQRVAQVDPPAAISSHSQQELLPAAGFVDITETDVSDEYLRVARALVEARQRHAADLRRSEGEAAFAQSQESDRAKVAAIEAGLLHRSLFVARRPVRA